MFFWPLVGRVLMRLPDELEEDELELDEELEDELELLEDDELELLEDDELELLDEELELLDDEFVPVWPPQPTKSAATRHAVS